MNKTSRLLSRLVLVMLALAACAPPAKPAITPANLHQVKQIVRLGRGAPLHIAWSPDGQLFALTTAIGIYLYNYNDQAEEQRFLETNASGPSAFSPDGKLLASVGESYTIKLWDTASGAVTHTLGGHKDKIQALAFSPDGRLLAAGSADNIIKLWPIADGAAPKTLSGGAHLSPRCLAFSPDGQTLASGGAGALVLWETASGQPRVSITTVEDLRPDIGHLAYSPDGLTLAAWGGQKAAVYWFDAVTGSLRRKFAAAVSFAYAAEGKLFATGGDLGVANKVNIWSGDHPDKVKITKQADFGLVLDLAFKPDGSLLASLTQDNIVRFWNTADGTVTKSFNRGVKGIDGIAFSPDGLTVAVAGPGGVDQWDIAAGDVLRALDAPSRWLMCVVFAPDGRTVLAGEWGDEADIWLWDIAEENNFRLLKWHNAAVRALAYSPDGRRLASGGWDNSVAIWNTANYQISRTIRTSANVYSLAFSPEGNKLAVGQVNGTLEIWAAAGGSRPLLTFSGHTGAVSGVAFTPDGQTLISVGGWDNSLRFWNTATGQLRQTASGNKWIGSLAVSPDGRLVVSGEAGGLIQIRDPQTGASLRTLTGHTAEVVSLAFDRYGTRLLSGSNDGTARVWGLTAE